MVQEQIVPVQAAVAATEAAPPKKSKKAKAPVSGKGGTYYTLVCT